jgi:prepilin-type N-terminal cleavage/methylation domain-containing protein
MIRRLVPDAGFTLAEVLTATTIVAIGLVAAAVAFQHAISGIETGRGESIATFLAEQKVEELRGVALVDWAAAALAPSTTTEYCRPSGDRCTVTPAPGAYRRATTVADSPAGTCPSTRCKMVRVVVFFRSITGESQLDQERRIDITTMFASRT